MGNLNKEIIRFKNLMISLINHLHREIVDAEIKEDEIIFKLNDNGVIEYLSFPITKKFLDRYGFNFEKVKNVCSQ